MRRITNNQPTEADIERIIENSSGLSPDQVMMQLARVALSQPAERVSFGYSFDSSRNNNRQNNARGGWFVNTPQINAVGRIPLSSEALSSQIRQINNSQRSTNPRGAATDTSNELSLLQQRDHRRYVPFLNQSDEANREDTLDRIIANYVNRTNENLNHGEDPLSPEDFQCPLAMTVLEQDCIAIDVQLENSVIIRYFNRDALRQLLSTRGNEDPITRQPLVISSIRIATDMIYRINKIIKTHNYTDPQANRMRKAANRRRRQERSLQISNNSRSRSST